MAEDPTGNSTPSSSEQILSGTDVAIPVAEVVQMDLILLNEVPHAPQPDWLSEVAASILCHCYPDLAHAVRLVNPNVKFISQFVTSFEQALEIANQTANMLCADFVIQRRAVRISGEPFQSPCNLDFVFVIYLYVAERGVAPINSVLVAPNHRIIAHAP